MRIFPILLLVKLLVAAGTDFCSDNPCGWNQVCESGEEGAKCFCKEKFPETCCSEIVIRCRDPSCHFPSAPGISFDGVKMVKQPGLNHGFPFWVSDNLPASYLRIFLYGSGGLQDGSDSNPETSGSFDWMISNGLGWRPTADKIFDQAYFSNLPYTKCPTSTKQWLKTDYTKQDTDAIEQNKNVISDFVVECSDVKCCDEFIYKCKNSIGTSLATAKSCNLGELGNMVNLEYAKFYKTGETRNGFPFWKSEDGKWAIWGARKDDKDKSGKDFDWEIGTIEACDETSCLSTWPDNNHMLESRRFSNGYFACPENVPVWSDWDIEFDQTPAPHDLTTSKLMCNPENVDIRCGGCADIACNGSPNQSCKTDSEGSKCKCDEGYRQIDQHVTSCSGGTCDYQEETLVCEKMDFCTINPCGVHASCENGETERTCTCNEGYAPKVLDCGTQICLYDYCQSKPCRDNEWCENGMGFPICHCIDFCEDVKCGENQTCVSGPQAGQCVCDDGFQQVTTNVCASFAYLCKNEEKNMKAFDLADGGVGRPFEKYESNPDGCNVVASVNENCRVFKYDYPDFGGDNVRIFQSGLKNWGTPISESSLCCSCDSQYGQDGGLSSADKYRGVCGPSDGEILPVQCEASTCKPDSCGEKQECVDTQFGAKCQCEENYVIFETTDSGITCVFDYCKLSTCGEHQVCKRIKWEHKNAMSPFEGFAKCFCEEGYGQGGTKGLIELKNYQNRENLKWDVSTVCKKVRIRSSVFDTEKDRDMVNVWTGEEKCRCCNDYDNGVLECNELNPFCNNCFHGFDNDKVDVTLTPVDKLFFVRFTSGKSVAKFGFSLYWSCVDDEVAEQELSCHKYEETIQDPIDFCKDDPCGENQFCTNGDDTHLCHCNDNYRRVGTKGKFEKTPYGDFENEKWEIPTICKEVHVKSTMLLIEPNRDMLQITGQEDCHCGYWWYDNINDRYFWHSAYNGYPITDSCNLEVDCRTGYDGTGNDFALDITPNEDSRTFFARFMSDAHYSSVDTSNYLGFSVGWTCKDELLECTDDWSCDQPSIIEAPVECEADTTPEPLDPVDQCALVNCHETQECVIGKTHGECVCKNGDRRKYTQGIIEVKSYGNKLDWEWKIPTICKKVNFFTTPEEFHIEPWYDNLYIDSHYACNCCNNYGSDSTDNAKFWKCGGIQEKPSPLNPACASKCFHDDHKGEPGSVILTTVEPKDQSFYVRFTTDSGNVSYGKGGFTIRWSCAETFTGDDYIDDAAFECEADTDQPTLHHVKSSTTANTVITVPVNTISYSLPKSVRLDFNFNSVIEIMTPELEKAAHKHDMYLAKIDAQYAGEDFSRSSAINIESTFHGKVLENRNLTEFADTFNTDMFKAAQSALSNSTIPEIAQSAIPVVRTEAVFDPIVASLGMQCPLLDSGGCTDPKFNIEKYRDHIYTVDECRALCARIGECEMFSVGSDGRMGCDLIKDGCDVTAGHPKSTVYRLSDCTSCVEGQLLAVYDNMCVEFNPTNLAINILDDILHDVIGSNNAAAEVTNVREELPYLRKQRTKLYNIRDSIKTEFERLVSEELCNPDVTITESEFVLGNAPECGNDFSEVFKTYGSLLDWIETFNCKCGSTSSFCYQRKESVKTTLEDVLGYICHYRQ